MPRRLALPAVLMLALLTVLPAPPADASPAPTLCTNFEPGSHSNETLAEVEPWAEVGEYSAVRLELQQQEDCENEGALFVQAAVQYVCCEPVNVTVFLQTYADGVATTVAGSERSEADFSSSRVTSNIYEVTGQYVRACALVQAADGTGTPCAPWFQSSPTSEERLATIRAASVGPTAGTEGPDVIAGFEELPEVDFLHGPDSGEYSIFGLGGDDLLLGGSGWDELYGGTGLDTLDPGTGGALMVTVGDGPGDYIRSGPDYDIAYIDTGDVVAPGVEEVYVDQAPPCSNEGSSTLDPPGCTRP